MENYVTYHLHTEDSLLDSCTNYKLYVDKAVELGQTAIAFTEHGVLYNWIEKKLYCDKNDIRYIHGVEIYLTYTLEEKVRDNYHTILLAKNYEGVKEINKLVDLATTPSHFYYKPRLTFEEFFNISKNVIKISACLASPLNKFPSSVNNIYERIEELTKEKDRQIAEVTKELQDEELEDSWIHSYDDADYDHGVPWAWRCTPQEAYQRFVAEKISFIEKKHCEEVLLLKQKVDVAKEVYDKLINAYDYFEIQPHVNSLDQIRYNKNLYEMARMYNKPLIAGTDTHSLDKYKAECRSILQKAKRIEFANEDEFDLTYKSYEELVAMFQKQGALPMNVVLEAINNTNKVAAMVEDFVLDTSFKYPKLYEDEERVFKERINHMYKEKLKKGIIKKDPRYKENVKEEMRVFKKIGMVGFMLFMSELVTWCWENDIPVGFCRGSVGGSTIAYLTDIIDVDPIVWGTVFSRFANEDRKEIGDIDLDIAPSQRHLVYEHIIEKFGSDKTAYVLAIGTISDKGTIDEIGRALDIPLDTLKEVKKQYGELTENISVCKERIKNIESDKRFKAVENLDLSMLDKHDAEYKLLSDYKEEQAKLNDNQEELRKLKEEDYKDLFYYFDGLVGTAISQSMHPAGIIVSPVTLPDNYGTFWSKDGKRILNINMEEIHEVSLVKYDLLGLKNVEIIHDCCKLVGIPYPKAHEVNWNDKEVWDHIADSAVGIFQFESNYSFDLLKGYKPQRINDLSLVNASLRPSGESYRDRLLAREPNHNPSALIDELLADNNGYLVFQEDTIKFLTNVCGLSGSDADNIRRAIGRKQIDRLQEALPQILEGYCRMSPHSREVAEVEAKAFLQIIEDSSNYQFGYNHSTGYSMIGYMCAYLRYYYPKEFITAYLNNANNDDDINAGTELAKLLKIKIHGIQFRHSIAAYSCDSEGIYKGIESIKYLNASMANDLYSIREEKFESFISLLERISEFAINSKQLTILIELDFFAEFGEIKELLKQTELFNRIKGKKQVKVDKLEELEIPQDLIEKHATRKTAKIYKGFDWIKLLEDIVTNYKYPKTTIVDKINYQYANLGYCDLVIPNLEPLYYYVEKIDGKYGNKMVTLYQLNSGDSEVMKVKRRTLEESPLVVGNMIKVLDSSEEKKWGKTPDGDWYQKEDTETILKKYSYVL